MSAPSLEQARRLTPLQQLTVAKQARAQIDIDRMPQGRESQLQSAKLMRTPNPEPKSVFSLYETQKQQSPRHCLRLSC